MYTNKLVASNNVMRRNCNEGCPRPRYANEAGSSRSCAARDGSDLWMSPSVAVLTGVESPNAPPAARGGGMKKMSCC